MSWIMMSLGREIEGKVFILESTVYPGVTEEVVKPILEQSGLQCGEDFKIGYSPERINPGDKEHRVTNILKITSGSTPEIADYVDELYKSIITCFFFISQITCEFMEPD